MAETINVYVPDQSEPFVLPASLSQAEIRDILTNQGVITAANAVSINADGDLVFARVVGGTKGRG
jgi:hypothetical protein